MPLQTDMTRLWSSCSLVVPTWILAQCTTGHLLCRYTITNNRGCMLAPLSPSTHTHTPSTLVNPAYIGTLVWLCNFKCTSHKRSCYRITFIAFDAGQCVRPRGRGSPPSRGGSERECSDRARCIRGALCFARWPHVRGARLA